MYDPIPFSTRDVSAALPDFIALRAGVRIEDPDPVAETMYRRLTTLSELAGNLWGLPPNAPLGELGRALVSSDFGTSLATGLNKIVSVGYQRQAGEWLPLLLDLPTKGMRPVQVPAIDLGELGPVPQNGGAVPLAMATIISGETVTPKVWSARFMVGRELLINDGLEIIANAVSMLTGQAARLTPRLIGAALVANGNLADGAALIGTANTTTETGLDIASLGEAMEKLRGLTTPAGNTANATGKFLIVPPSKEATARVLVSSLTYGAQPPALTVLVNPWSGTASYLAADPEELPSFARVYPRGINPNPSVERGQAFSTGENGEAQYFDGQGFEFIQYIGIQPVGRGLVKIPAA